MNKWYPIAIGGGLVGLGVWAFSGEAKAPPGGGGGVTTPPVTPGGGGSGGKAGTLIIPATPAGSTLPLCASGIYSTIQGGAARPGFASNPAIQWYYTVQSGDNASRIAKMITGDDRRFDELVAYAKNTYAKSKTTVLPSGIICVDYVPLKSLKTKGDRANKYSSGYNWADSTPIMPNDRIPVPMTWNEYIDEQGTMKGGASLLNDGGLAPSYYS